MKRNASSPRGGLRQRLRRQHETHDTVNQQSALFTLLLHLFAWGEISPQLCQTIVEAGYKDAVSMKEGRTNLAHLERMSAIGSSGRYPNKCYGDLMARIPFKVKIPVSMSASLPFKMPLRWLRQSFLLPHELFAAIWNFYPHTWAKYIKPSAERVAQFWDANFGHPAMQTHSVRLRPDLREKAVPISFHGDDVPITGVGKSWCNQMTTFSWTSLVGAGETRDSMFFIYGCFERIREVNVDQTKDTLGRFFKILVWSLHWLYLGQWPDRDFEGKMCLVDY